MIDAPCYAIFTHSFSFSLWQTHKREICCQQIAKILQPAGSRRLVFLFWNQCQCHRDGNVACLVALLVTTLVRGLVGTSGLSGVYNRKYMSWARRKYIFGFILHILTCTTYYLVKNYVSSDHNLLALSPTESFCRRSPRVTLGKSVDRAPLCRFLAKTQQRLLSTAVRGTLGHPLLGCACL